MNLFFNCNILCDIRIKYMLKYSIYLPSSWHFYHKGFQNHFLFVISFEKKKNNGLNRLKNKIKVLGTENLLVVSFVYTPLRLRMVGVSVI